MEGVGLFVWDSGAVVQSQNTVSLKIRIFHEKQKRFVSSIFDMKNYNSFHVLRLAASYKKRTIIRIFIYSAQNMLKYCLLGFSLVFLLFTEITLQHQTSISY